MKLADQHATVTNGTDSFYDRVLKRMIDFCLSIVFLILLSPFMLIISVLIRLDSRGPIFYRGVRSGRNGGTFRIFKFRTMVQDAEKLGGGTTALNDARITRMGGVLRKSKFDEIPQLLNIVVGHMSFIGPRPELPKYTDMYEGLERIILSIRPGITDISSIEFISLDEVVGSDNADEAYEKYVFKRKNQLRIEYVTKQSFRLDMKLFSLTVYRVVQKIISVILRRKEGSKHGVYNTEKF